MCDNLTVFDEIKCEIIIMKSNLHIDGEVHYTNVSCDEILKMINWKDAKVVTSLLILAIVNMVVIIGNCLVITAVFISTKLRTVTNLFIVSLAVADLMVGLAVLPFSATWEIFEIWIFGEVWCSMWLAADVWMCTASILNLCAISMDRYVAVTRPVTYPSIMSPKKAKILIGTVWILSFVICFPPLVGWNDRKRTFFRQLLQNTTMDTRGDDTGFSKQTDTELQSNSIQSNIMDEQYHLEECSLTCELTSDKGYVVYSAIGSFFLPMFVMLFFYWRIYLAAVETTRAINQGFRTTKGSKLLGTRFEEQRLTLRIHRGRSVQNHHHHHHHAHHHQHHNHHSVAEGRSISPHSAPGGAGSSSSGRLLPPSSLPEVSPSIHPLQRSKSHERIKVHLTPPPRVSKRAASYRPHKNTLSINNYSTSSRRSILSSSSPGESTTASPCHQLDSLSLPTITDGRRLIHATDSESSTPSASPTICPPILKYESIPCSNTTEDSKPKFISKMGKRNIKVQVKRFHMETKAAKTLGIIVGGFIVCWLPFFIMYVWRAFCEKCIPRLLFSVFFWLGYVNSALNPCIYAYFNRDFRAAFKKIICRCICQKEKKNQPQVVPIFLSSLGDDSDGNNEPNSSNFHQRTSESH